LYFGEIPFHFVEAFAVDLEFLFQAGAERCGVSKKVGRGEDGGV
jgi:hypothetical protein